MMKGMMMVQKTKISTLIKLSKDIDQFGMSIVNNHEGGFTLKCGGEKATPDMVKLIKKHKEEIKKVLFMDMSEYFQDVGNRLAASMPIDYVISDAIKESFSKKQRDIDESWADALRGTTFTKMLRFKKCVDDWEVWWMARFKDHTDKKSKPKTSPREQRPSLAVKFQNVSSAIKNELDIENITLLESWAIDNHPELADDLSNLLNGIWEIVKGGGDVTKFDGLLAQYQEFWRGIHSLYVMENQ